MSKILHLCLDGTFNDEGTYQDNILPKYHVKLGNDVSIVCSIYFWDYDQNQNVIDERKEYYLSSGVKVIRLPLKHGDMSNKFKKYIRLKETIDKERPDIIFVHGPAHLDNSIIAQYCKTHPNVVLYVDNHADFSNSATNWISKNILHKIIWKHYAQKLVPYAKKFYGVLPARVDFLIDIYNIPKDKCELLVMGADDEEVEKANNAVTINRLRKKYSIEEDDFLIVTGGVINKWKYQTLLLMEAVQNIDQNIKLIVFGPVVSELRERVDKLVDGKKIQYIGWLHANDTYQYFAAADLAVFPGRHSVFWEQVTGQGIPMLVKDWPGTHHVDLGGNVKFLKDDSVEEIQEKLEYIIKNSQEYQIMKEVAATKGMKKFSYMEIAKKSIEQKK